jgi:hypothetical protein
MLDRLKVRIQEILRGVSSLRSFRNSCWRRAAACRLQGGSPDWRPDLEDCVSPRIADRRPQAAKGTQGWRPVPKRHAETAMRRGRENRAAGCDSLAARGPPDWRPALKGTNGGTRLVAERRSQAARGAPDWRPAPTRRAAPASNGRDPRQYTVACEGEDPRKYSVASVGLRIQEGTP